MAPRAPLLVAVEGIDGSGVSTHSRLLAARLGAELEKEPSSGPVGSLVRRALGGGEPVLARNEVLALLFAADRFTHLYGCLYGGAPRCVLGLLLSGVSVVLDRYKYSSIAYQGVDGGLGAADEEWLWLVNAYAPPPHVLVYLDVSPRTSWARLLERSRREVMEEPGRLERVAEAFQRLIQRLSLQPEYCPGRGPRPPWERLLESLSPGAAPRLYPPRACYPSVAVVRGETGEGAPRPVEEVAADVAAAVAGAAAAASGSEPPGWARERLAAGARESRVRLIIHRRR